MIDFEHFETDIELDLPQERVGTPKKITYTKKLTITDRSGNEVVSSSYPSHHEESIIKAIVKAAPDLKITTFEKTVTLYYLGDFEVLKGDEKGKSIVRVHTWGPHEESHNRRLEEVRQLLVEKGIVASNSKCVVTIKKEC